MVALADAVHEGRITKAEISVVVSEQANAAGLVRESERGSETLVRLARTGSAPVAPAAEQLCNAGRGPSARVEGWFVPR